MKYLCKKNIVFLSIFSICSVHAVEESKDDGNTSSLKKRTHTQRKNNGHRNDNKVSDSDKAKVLHSIERKKYENLIKNFDVPRFEDFEWEKLQNIKIIKQHKLVNQLSNQLFNQCDKKIEYYNNNTCDVFFKMEKYGRTWGSFEKSERISALIQMKEEKERLIETPCISRFEDFELKIEDFELKNFQNMETTTQQGVADNKRDKKIKNKGTI